MSEKILFVDDEQNILNDFRRQLRKKFREEHQDIEIETALNGNEGLQALEEKGTYAVVVSDMRMPGMDGIEFLSCVREKSPDTVRIMLTGQPTMDTAIDAVNEGRLFRFLTKPCTLESLTRVILLGVHEYKIAEVEKRLLEKASNRRKPREHALHSNAPNPFHEETTISYEMKEAGAVSLKIYDILGQEVSTLVQEEQSEGSHYITWDASGKTPGTYLCKLEVEGFVRVRRLLLVKKRASS